MNSVVDIAARTPIYRSEKSLLIDAELNANTKIVFIWSTLSRAWTDAGFPLISIRLLRELSPVSFTAVLLFYLKSPTSF